MARIETPCPNDESSLAVASASSRCCFAISISGDVNGQFAKFAFEGFLTLAVAGVAPRIGNRLVLVVPQMLRHLCFKRTFNQSLGQLLEQARFLQSDLQAFCNPPAGGLSDYQFVAYAHFWVFWRP